MSGIDDPSMDTQHSPHFQCSPCKTDWQLNVSMGTVPRSDPLWAGWAGCPQGCDSGMQRWHSSAQSPEVSLSGGAGCSRGSCWDVQPGAGQPRAGAVWSGRSPVLHTLQLCSHMKIPARSGGCSSLEPDFVPGCANGSSLGSPGRKAVRKGAF